MIDAVPAVRQCAAVRTARGAMTVPEQEPFCRPLASFMFNRTTDAVAVLHSLPLTTATVWPLIAPHAAETGVVGAGDGEVDVDDEPLPPHAAEIVRKP